jgi:hypothetical protein
LVATAGGLVHWTGDGELRAPQTPRRARRWLERMEGERAFRSPRSQPGEPHQGETLTTEPLPGRLSRADLVRRRRCSSWS